MAKISELISTVLNSSTPEKGDLDDSAKEHSSATRKVPRHKAIKWDLARSVLNPSHCGSPNQIVQHREGHRPLNENTPLKKEASSNEGLKEGENTSGTKLNNVEINKVTNISDAITTEETNPSTNGSKHETPQEGNNYNDSETTRKGDVRTRDHPNESVSVQKIGFQGFQEQLDKINEKLDVNLKRLNETLDKEKQENLSLRKENMKALQQLTELETKLAIQVKELELTSEINALKAQNATLKETIENMSLLNAKSKSCSII